jgi:hypothetical protein
MTKVKSQKSKVKSQKSNACCELVLEFCHILSALSVAIPKNKKCPRVFSRA